MDKNLTAKERILLFLEHKHISKASFFEEVGISSSNFKGENIKSKIGSDALVKILTIYPKLSADWLLTGEGEMLKDRRNKVTAVQSDTPETGIPLIPIEAMAGFFTGEVCEYDRNCENLYIPGMKADFVVPVSGDSMEPKYYSGDLVACQMVNISDIFFQWGKVYVIDARQGVLIKKVKKSKLDNCITLISENSEYEDVILPISDIYHISLVKAVVRFV